MRTLPYLLLVALVMGCGSSSEPDPEAKTPKNDAVKDPTPTAATPAPTPNYAELLLGSWDGMQIKTNSRGTVPLVGVFTLAPAGNLKFDGKANGSQVVGFGSWKVQDGQLQYTVEGSNYSREIPNGTSGAVKIREVSDTEFLYIDLSDNRTYSARRVPDGAPRPAPRGKTKG